MKNTKKFQNFAFSKFYCTNCGKLGLTIPRKEGKQREEGHLKKLWCLKCQKEQNFVEIREFGTYTYEDFRQEFELGRFIDGNRIPINELNSCEEKCKYNINKKCWNSNHSFKCGRRLEEAQNDNQLSIRS